VLKQKKAALNTEPRYASLGIVIYFRGHPASSVQLPDGLLLPEAPMAGVRVGSNNVQKGVWVFRLVII
jgi:hypothetical protein